METATLLWGLIFSSIGIGYFIYGRKQSNLVVRWCGLALILLGKRIKWLILPLHESETDRHLIGLSG
jgi:hypothetical protein